MRLAFWGPGRGGEDSTYWPVVADVFIGFSALLLLVAVALYSTLATNGVEPPPAKRDFAKEFRDVFQQTSGSSETNGAAPSLSDAGFSELKIYFPAAFLFETCRTELKTPAVAELENLKRLLKSFDSSIDRVQITGHTDSDRPTLRSYCGDRGILSNWDLSARRAITVLKLLAPDDSSGLNPRKVWGAALGEYHPVDGLTGAKSEVLKAKDRRIEVLVRFAERGKG